MRFLFLMLLLPGLAFGASSKIAFSSRDRVSLVSQSNTPVNGTILLGLRFQLAPGWHIYWSNPGDAGYPPQISLTAPASAGPVSYPPPQFLLEGPVAAYVLSGDVLLPFTASNVGERVSAQANWLVCSDICVPEHAQFSLALDGGASAEAGLFSSPAVLPAPFSATIDRNGRLIVAGLTSNVVQSARFFPQMQDAIDNRAPQPLRFGPDGLTLKLKRGPGFDPGQDLIGVLELTDPSGATQALALTAVPAKSPALPLLPWLAFGFLGGLILNLMPCVFPVLAMKALTLIRFGGTHRAEIRREALGYTAGVLTAMLALGVTLLAARGFGTAIGWGFQFQSPSVVALIAWVIFAVGLNLAGVFEVALPFNIAQPARPGGFFTGLLAVITATPCTAPFMGGAVAGALTAPLPAALGIFLALGLGLAAPFLLFALIPALAAALPRPGRWMVTLQRLLSLPMFATFLWLAWVVTRQAGPQGLTLLMLGTVCLALALTVRLLRPAALLMLLLLPFLHSATGTAALSLPGAEPYSATRLAQLRASGSPVFIDLTASWCVTCLLNERTTLMNRAVREGFAARHVHVLVGDWTNRNAEIARLLRDNNRDGVPFYLYYPPAGPPVTLPQILTPRIVLNLIGQSAGQQPTAQTLARGG